MTVDPAPDAISGGVPRCSQTAAPSLLRPYSIGLILLAFGVFLWGFGYKLSLYHVHDRSAAHASVVRMWVESKSARTLQLAPRAYAYSVADLDLTERNSFSLQESGRTVIPPAPRSASFLLDSLLPSRAPPAPVAAGPVQG